MNNEELIYSECIYFPILFTNICSCCIRCINNTVC